MDSASKTQTISRTRDAATTASAIGSQRAPNSQRIVTCPRAAWTTTEISPNSRRKVSVAIVSMVVTYLETNSVQPDHLLVNEVLAGQRDVYAHIVHRYERHDHAAAWAILGDHQTTEDVTQETFVKAYNKLNTLRFSLRLMTIARRTATDLARSRSRLILVPTAIARWCRVWFQDCMDRVEVKRFDREPGFSTRRMRAWGNRRKLYNGILKM